MRVSIVIPTLDQGRFIGQCLRSIQAQSHRELEIIVQDCASRDETQRICEEFLREDPRIRYYHESDSGQSDGINRGLARSTGTLWTWMPSDDFYGQPDAIAGMVADFEWAQRRESSCVGVFGRANYVTKDGEWLRDYEQFERDLTRADFQHDWPLCQPASLLLREAVAACAGVDQSLTFAMDLDLLLRVLQGDRRLVFSPRSVACVRVHSTSKSVKHARETARTALAVIRRRMGSVGNPFRSAYAGEYSRATQQEWRQWGRWFRARVRRRWRRGPPELLFRMGPETGYAGVIPLNQLRMSEDEQGLVLESSGIDPHLLIPGIRVPRKGLVQVRVQLAPPAPTLMQVFYQRNGPIVGMLRKLTAWPPAFAERRSLSVAISPHGSVPPFHFPGRLLERALRLDPGSLPGRYRLRSLEVRSVPLGRMARAFFRMERVRYGDRRLVDCILRLWVVIRWPPFAWPETVTQPHPAQGRSRRSELA